MSFFWKAISVSYLALRATSAKHNKNHRIQLEAKNWASLNIARGVPTTWYTEYRHGKYWNMTESQNKPLLVSQILRCLDLKYATKKLQRILVVKLLSNKKDILALFQLNVRVYNINRDIILLSVNPNFLRILNKKEESIMSIDEGRERLKSLKVVQLSNHNRRRD